MVCGTKWFVAQNGLCLGCKGIVAFASLMVARRVWYQTLSFHIVPVAPEFRQAAPMNSVMPRAQSNCNCGQYFGDLTGDGSTDKTKKHPYFLLIRFAKLSIQNIAGLCYSLVYVLIKLGVHKRVWQSIVIMSLRDVSSTSPRRGWLTAKRVA